MMPEDMTSALQRARAAIEQGDVPGALMALDDIERIAKIKPEIAIYMDGGLIQEVYRANGAPFTLYVHDHDIEGTSSDVCEVTWPNGSTEDAVISTHDHKDDTLLTSEPYWHSLREPVIVEPAFDDDDAGDDSDDEDEPSS